MEQSHSCEVHHDSLVGDGGAEVSAKVAQGGLRCR